VVVGAAVVDADLVGESGVLLPDLLVGVPWC
jgi:hypothetical protein